MTKRFFTSLLLGFGCTLAVLVAISMPPGGWSVAVGVALGLLAALPLFLVVMALLKRQPLVNPQTASLYSSYSEPRPITPVVVIQQQLPQGQSMPLPANFQPYAYGTYPEQYDNYGEQEYLPDPRLWQASKRHQSPEYVPLKRSGLERQQFEQNYYAYNNNQPAYADYAFPTQNQLQAQYEAWDNQTNFESYESYDDYYYDGEQLVGQNIVPPDLAYYEEQQMRRRSEARGYDVRPNQPTEYSDYNRYRAADFNQNQIEEAEYREINGFDEE